jgi:L,D-transpeptidase YcbB
MQNQVKMKTTTHQPAQTTVGTTILVNLIVTRIVHASLILTKYSYWFLALLIFTSCQKNLTQADHSPVASNIVDTVTQNFLPVDTSVYAIANHMSSLSNAEVNRKIEEKIIQFYSANSFKTKWVQTNSPSPLYYALIDHLKNAGNHGLNPETYEINRLEQYVDRTYSGKPAALSDLIDADIRITEAFCLFTLHLREGRISNPGSGSKIWMTYNRHPDHSDIKMLATAKNSADLDHIVVSVQPKHEQYSMLQKALVAYRSFEKSETQELLISGRETIKPEDKHVAVPAIRRKLWLMDIQVNSGEAVDSTSSGDSLYYDKGLQAAVKIFQRRHGLEPDGIIGNKTVVWLNQSFKEKADLIAVNMERLRWLPDNYSSHCIRVNIPEYKLRIYEEGTKSLEMNVIVGAVHSPTPVFRDTLEHIVFSPTWTVPPSIMKEEVLPRLKKNNTYYAEKKNFTFYKNGVEIDPSTVQWDTETRVNEYRLVQKPGPDNSLGLAKFIMPNDMNIYLHDTPDHKPFSHHYRALSHGCIRLDDPAKLAAYMLQEEAGWDLKTIKKAMNSGKPTKVVLTKAYEVHLEYHTVWADDKGKLHFREDIYGHDQNHLEHLFQENTPALASR